LSQKRAMIDAFLLSRPVGNIDEDVLSLQDELLQGERLKIIDDLKYKKHISEIEADLFAVECDMLVVFSEHLFGGYVEKWDNLDNLLTIKGGLQINEQFYQKFIADSMVISYTNPYIVESKNLWSRFLGKIVLSDDQNLESCISGVLDFIKANGFKTVALDISKFDNEKISWLKNLVRKCVKIKKLKTNFIFIKLK